MIGLIGNVVFSVSSEYIKTFQNMNLKKSARIAQHDLIGQKPRLEFQGAGLYEGSFDIQLRADFGVDVKAEIDNLTQLMDEGIICPLIVGNDFWGDFLISDVGIAFNIVRTNGRIQSAMVSIDVKEYT